MTIGAQIDLVVDTNIIVSLLSNNAEEVEQAERYRPHLEGKSLAISFQTEAELWVQHSVQGWADEPLRRMIGRFHIVQHSPELHACYIRIRTEAFRRNSANKEPRTGPADGWVAAAAMQLGVPLVTHDYRLSHAPLIHVVTEPSE